MNAPNSQATEAVTGAKPPRWVISWFGYKIRNLELFPNEELGDWMARIANLAKSHGLRAERLANNIDLIIGKAPGSVTRREFFFFQRLFEELNEEFGLCMSGVLWLMDANDPCRKSAIWEVYNLGRKVVGDSIGRPAHSSLKAIRAARAHPPQPGPTA